MANEKLKCKELDRLFNGVLMLKDLEECYMFFEDLCSMSEIKSFAQRFQVAELLHEKVTYNAISYITKASTATISRINRSLEYGNGGYVTIIDRLKAEEKRGE
ncbi:MAG: YerC/YecD family TrpR-related protein [Clostridia bacterium]|nr:YerC/YecD family TrpR-related protein [Clostridia bacterium]